MSDLAAVRQQYAEELREIAHVRSSALVRAFASVERERYLGPGPWEVMDLGSVYRGAPVYRPTPDADPVHLYRDVLVAIDRTRFLNNGQPSAHALWMDALDPRPGDHVVHIGCGTGYYSAILAAAVGATGRVTAVEISPDLAARAQRNLAHLANVHVVQGDGCVHDPGVADAIYVNAGATHPLPLWLDRLRLGGRLIVPLVRWPSSPEEGHAAGHGVVVKISHHEAQDAAEILSPVAIFPCLGAVDVTADRNLAAALERGVAADVVRILRRDQHEAGPACWLHGDGFCLSSS